MNRTYRLLGLFVCLCAILIGSAAVFAQGGGTINPDRIKVTKRFYVASNSTLLINANSSDATAHLYLYHTRDRDRSSGAYIGEVQNGAGGKYGGTVFYSAGDPRFLTIISSSHGRVTVPTLPYHP